MRSFRSASALSLLLALSTTAASAQSGPTFGLLAGVTSSKVTLSGDAVTVDLGSRTGFSGGVSLRTPLSPMFDLEVDALYAQKGFKIDDSDSDASAEVKLGYIDIPVLLSYRFGTGPTQPFIAAGGTVSIKIGCDLGATSGGISASTDCAEVVEGDIAGMDLGLTVGAGIRFNRFSLQARYTSGLSEVVDDGEDNVTNHNRALFFLAGVSF
jgi:hypothetical protein